MLILAIMFFVSDTKAKATKAKIKKWDYIKPNNFGITNESINKMNREPIKLQEILPNRISDEWSTQFNSVQSLGHVQLFAIPWTAAHQAFLSFTLSQSLLKFMSIQPSHPLLSPSPPALNLYQHQGLFQ